MKLINKFEINFNSLTIKKKYILLILKYLNIEFVIPITSIKM